MNEVFKIKSLKPNPKIQQKLINFEKSQNFSKTQKLRFQNMKCIKWKRLEAYQVKKILRKLEETLRKRFWSEMREFRRGRFREIEREIDRNERQIARGV